MKPINEELLLRIAGSTKGANTVKELIMLETYGRSNEEGETTINDEEALEVYIKSFKTTGFSLANIPIENTRTGIGKRTYATLQKYLLEQDLIANPREPLNDPFHHWLSLTDCVRHPLSNETLNETNLRKKLGMKTSGELLRILCSWNNTVKEPVDDQIDLTYRDTFRMIRILHEQKNKTKKILGDVLKDAVSDSLDRIVRTDDLLSVTALDKFPSEVYSVKIDQTARIAYSDRSGDGIERGMLYVGGIRRNSHGYRLICSAEETKRGGALKAPFIVIDVADILFYHTVQKL